MKCEAVGLRRGERAIVVGRGGRQEVETGKLLSVARVVVVRWGDWSYGKLEPHESDGVIGATISLSHTKGHEKRRDIQAKSKKGFPFVASSRPG